MDIQLIREFLDLSFTLNFSKTAQRVYISQSALSKHIAQIEKELGTTLLIRDKQSVQLTPIGTVVRDRLQKVITDYDEVLAVLENDRSELQGVLKIGFLDAAMKNLLAASIQTYTTRYPHMRINLSNYEVGELANALAQNAVDLALNIVFPNSAIPHNTYFRPLYNDGISAVVSRNNPLSQMEEIRFEDLLEYPMILPSPIQYPAYASIIRKMVEAAPEEAKIICDFTNVNTALVMVESEMGVSILPSNVSNMSTSAVFIKIKGTTENLQIGAMWKKDSTATGLEEFVKIICDTAAEMFYSQS
ncbi:MAG: LysR family transcriptional regulator [Parasporobacterium sp.]|nr:LysR family transcriptional regulator [Parasporobacterium sp.]